MILQDSAKGGYMHALPAGTTIFHQGETGAEMYIVLRGIVRLSRIINDKKIVVAEITQGGFFGEMSFLEGEARAANAETCCETILMIITKSNFDDVISKNPSVAFRIMTSLSSQLKGLNRNLPPIMESQTGSAACAESTAENFPETNECNPVTDIRQNEEIIITPDDINRLFGPQKHTDQSANMGPVVSPDLVALYTFNKQITCPVCDTKFETLMIRDSKLRLKERSKELRTIYHDIEPLLYNLWVCPSCNFSMRRSEFNKVSEIQKKNLANVLVQRQNKETLDFTKRYTFDFALKAYRIAIDCCDSFGKKTCDEMKAVLCLCRAWLYDDMGNTEAALEARKEALEKYNMSYTFGTERTDEQDQKIEYLIGKLSQVVGNNKEARTHLFKIVSRRNAHNLLKQMAQDELEILKKLD